MSKIICVTCGREMRVCTMGIIVIEMFGKSERPYRLWSADRYLCPECNTEVVSGFADKAFGEYYQENFAEKMADAVLQEHIYWTEY